MMKKTIIPLAILLVLVLGYFLYSWLTYEELDLAPLEKYAETENLDTLIAKVQSEPPGPDGFKFVVLGDTRSHFGTAQKVLEQAAKEDPAFILSNGDIVRRGRPSEFIAHHMRLVESIRPIPFITVPGNHEDGPNKEFAAFKAIYGKLNFSFDYGDCRFVGINNADRWGMTWFDLGYLEEQLSKPGAEHKFVVFHVPPEDLDVYVESEEGRGFTLNSQRFRRLMEEQEVDHVFMGHVHGYATTVTNGVRYTITGGGGASLAKRLPEEGRVHNYVVVHVRPDGLESEVVRLIGDEWVRTAI